MAKWLEKQYQTTPLGAVVENSMTSGSTVNAPSINAVQNAISNPNLLINGDFQIWQRGTSFGSANAVYTADRWRLYNISSPNLKIEKVNDGIRFTGSAGAFSIYQPLEAEFFAKNAGRPYVLSICLDGVVRVWRTGTIPSEPSNVVADISMGYDCTLNWVKLEFGEIATPFVPRFIGEELALCKRYYQKAFITIPVLNNQGGYYEFPIEMRAVPTVTYDAISFGIAGTALQTDFGSGTLYVSSVTADRIIFSQSFRDAVVALRCAAYCDAEIY